ncbi:MAG: ComF family protein [Betaproteobacteria bacterium]|nr:ComF family protein [Betaproteobacteria bacterium]
MPTLLPTACELCGAGSGKRQLCPACAARLPTPAPSCPVCALPSPAGVLCGACLKHPPPFAATLAAYLYAPPVDLLIQAFKFRGRLSLAPLLAQGLQEAITARGAVLPELILPMPLTRTRQRERGYNQAQEIARWLAGRLEIPLLAQAVRRVGEGPPQSSLPWKERARNIRGAFLCSAVVAGKRLAVVDDVMTTGATATELARALKAAGAAEVVNWMVARTLPPAD